MATTITLPNAGDVGWATVLNTAVTTVRDAADAETTRASTAEATKTAFPDLLAVATTAVALTVNKIQPFNTTAGAITATALPALSGLTVGTTYWVQKTDTTANTVTVPYGAGDLSDTGTSSAVVAIAETNALQVVTNPAGGKLWRPVNSIKPTATLNRQYLPVGNIYVNVDNYGADPTGAADSTAAFQAAYTAALAKIAGAVSGAFITVGAGTYKVTAGTLNANDPRIGLIGPGAPLCTISVSGSGDCFWHNTPTAMFSTRHNGLKIGGFTIDGTNVTGAARGLHVTDIGQINYDDLSVQNFTARPSTTLSAALATGTAITALPVAATPEAIPSGAMIHTISGAVYQSWITTAAAAAGATSLAVASTIPTFAFPIGSTVQPRSVGVYLDSTGGWSEKVVFSRTYVTNNDIGLCFDGVVTTGASFDYMRCFDVAISTWPGQLGLLMQNFAQLDQAHLEFTFNAHRTASALSQTILTVGNSAGDQSRIINAFLDIRGEVDTGGGSPAIDFNIGVNAKLQGTGVFAFVGVFTAGNGSSNGYTYVQGQINSPSMYAGNMQFKTQGFTSYTTAFPKPPASKGVSLLDMASSSGTPRATIWGVTGNPTGNGNYYGTAGDIAVRNDAPTVSGTQLYLCTTGNTWTPVVAASKASGSVTLVAGTSGSIANTLITANSIIRAFSISSGGTVGALSIVLVAATGFTINSTSSSDTSKVFYEVVQY